MFEQAPIAVRNEEEYRRLHAVIDAAFDGRDVDVLLTKVTRARLRIRDFEAILRRGFLGGGAGFVRRASGKRPGTDAGAVFAAGGESSGRPAAKVFQGLRVLLSQ